MLAAGAIRSARLRDQVEMTTPISPRRKNIDDAHLATTFTIHQCLPPTSPRRCILYRRHRHDYVAAIQPRPFAEASPAARSA